MLSPSLLAQRSTGPRGVSSPPFLILFIDSICNMKCEHCFYWQQLNQPNDLSLDELVKLSEELGPIENLNLSGGEPFLRKEFATICRQFIQRNGVKEICVPTNGCFTDRTIEALRQVLKESSLKLFGVELSLDGMPAFHDTFRRSKNSFRKAMETYDALVELQNEDPRLQIHAISDRVCDPHEPATRSHETSDKVAALLNDVGRREDCARVDEMTNGWMLGRLSTLS